MARLDRGIVRIGPGKYRAAIQIDGRRRWKRGSLDDCRKWLHEQRYGLAQARANVGRVPTLGEWLKTWLAEVGGSAAHGGTARRAPATMVNYHRRVALLAGLGDIRITDLRPDHVAGLYRSLLSGAARDSGGRPVPPLSAAYVREVAVVLRGALQAALNRGLVAVNVAKAVSPPGDVASDKPVGKRRALSDDEVGRILAAAREDPEGAVVVVLLTTGLRRGEALALRWENVHTDPPAWISVEHSAGPVTGQGMVLRAPKTRRGRRQIRIAAATVEALERAGLRAGESEFVFPSPRLPGRPMSAQHLGVIWERVRKAAGVQGATPHSVRHTIASRHIAEAPAAVAAYLGHDPVVMLRTYSHPSLQQTAFIAEAADRIAAQTPS